MALHGIFDNKKFCIRFMYIIIIVSRWQNIDFFHWFS